MRLRASFAGGWESRLGSEASLRRLVVVTRQGRPRLGLMRSRLMLKNARLARADGQRLSLFEGSSVHLVPVVPCSLTRWV